MKRIRRFNRYGAIYLIVAQIINLPLGALLAHRFWFWASILSIFSVSFLTLSIRKGMNN